MKVLIWSIQHGQWWKPNSLGYTSLLKQAGEYDSKKALEICAAANRGTGETPDEAIVPLTKFLKKAREKW